MTIIRLNWRARQTLERIAQSGSNAREVRRAQALLWLHVGESVTQVAQRLGLSRTAVYKIVHRYEARLAEPVVSRIRDRPHAGRPDVKRERVKHELSKLLPQCPKAYGHRAQVWSARLLRCEVERRLQLSVSTDTVRRGLRDLRYRYKRPRYVLARRSPTWRQAKGG